MDNIEQKRFEKKVANAISYLAASNLAAFSSLLRVNNLVITDDDDLIETACLSKPVNGTEYTITLNYNFCNQFNDKGVAGILFHEILHHVMRHIEKTQFENKQLANIVYDAFINRTIYQIEASLIRFAKDYYSATESPTLFLRSGSKPVDAIDKQMYRHLYKGQISETDLYNYLERKHPNIKDMKIVCIGTGVGDGMDGEVIEKEEIPGLLEDIIDKLGKDMKKNGQLAGKFSELLTEFIKVNKLGKDSSIEEAFKVSLTDSIKSQLITDVLGNTTEYGSQTVLMPSHPARSDMIQIGMGIPLIFWKNPDYGVKQGDVKIYVDVSGSVDSYKDWIYGVILAFEEYLHTNIFLFSNEVAEVTLGEFAQGKVVTTGGTDFNCIAKHMLENKYEKVIIFTDGYASMSADLQKEIKASNAEIYTIVIGEGRSYYTKAIEEFSTKVFTLPMK